MEEGFDHVQAKASPPCSPSPAEPQQWPQRDGLLLREAAPSGGSCSWLRPGPGHSNPGQLPGDPTLALGCPMKEGLRGQGRRPPPSIDMHSHDALLLQSTQDETEVTLKTEAEAGASGYSVTGGGDQGIFIKQVLKDSSAAKLFSLREGAEPPHSWGPGGDRPHLDSGRHPKDYVVSRRGSPRCRVFPPGSGGSFPTEAHPGRVPFLALHPCRLLPGAAERLVTEARFKIKRKLPAAEDEEWAAGEAEHGPKGSEKQAWPGTPGSLHPGRGWEGRPHSLLVPEPRASDSLYCCQQDQDVADGCTETPTKMLEGDGDQERLISKAREDRGRRPQRERLSWPKFQSIKTKRRPGPRRSHSSSEAYERGDVPDVSPTSTDTEAQLPGEERERRAGPGSQRKTRFLSLRFRMGSGKAAGLEGRGAPGGTVQAGVLEEAVPGEEGQGAAVVAADSRRKDSMAGVQEEAEPPTEPGLSLEGTLGEGAGLAPRSRKKKKEAKVQEETVPQRTSGVGAAPGCREEGPREGGQGLEIGIARLSLQEPRDQDSQDGREPEFQIRIPKLKTPKFTFPKGKALGAKGAGTALHLEDRQGGYPGEDLGTKEDGGGEPDAQGRPALVQKPDQEDRGTQEYATEKRVEDTKGRDRDVGGREGKTKMLKFKLPSFGWSPGKEQKGDAVKQPQETEKEENMLLSLQTDICQEDGGIRSRREKEMELPEQKLPQKETIETKEELAAGIGLKGHLPKVHMPGIKVPKVDLNAPHVDIKGPKLEVKGAKGEVTAPDLEVSLPSVEVDTQAPGAKLEGVLALGDKEVAAKENKFKMPEFKIPSFGVSAPGKSIETAVDVSLPKAQADVSLPSVQADVKTSDLSIELPPAELDVKAAEAAVKLPEGHLPEVELKEPAAGIGLKGHLPKVHVPGIKVPKVDLKAPQVDIKGPKLEVKGAKGEVTAPDLEVSLPSVEVDTQAPGAKLEGVLALGDKEVGAKDSKFKMPKLQDAIVRRSAPGKSIEAAVDVSCPGPGGTCPCRPAGRPAARRAGRQGRRGGGGAQGTGGGHRTEGHLTRCSARHQGPAGGHQGAQLEVKAPRAEVTAPDLEVSLPSVEVDTQARAPRWRAPGPGEKVQNAQVQDAIVRRVGARQVHRGRGGRVPAQGPGGRVPAVRAGRPARPPSWPPAGPPARGGAKEPAAGIGLKGHLPKVHVPGIKAPQVDIKGPKLGVRRAPRARCPAQRGGGHPGTGAKLEGVWPWVQGGGRQRQQVQNAQVQDAIVRRVGARQAIEAAVDVSLPRPRRTLSLPSVRPTCRPPSWTSRPPRRRLSSPKATCPRWSSRNRRGASTEGPPAKVHGGPQGPAGGHKGPKLEVKGAKGECDGPDLEVVPAQRGGGHPGTGRQAGGRPGPGQKFKMPKFKMPSFGVSAPGKSIEAAVDVSLPKAQADVSLPSVQPTCRPPSWTSSREAAVTPRRHLPEVELKEPARHRTEGHLPKVHVPAQGAQGGLKARRGHQGPKLEVKGAKASVEVDTQAPGAKLEGDLALGDKEVAAKEKKFKMPKFKMPSFGVSAPGKSIEAAVDVSLPKAQADVSLPPVTSALSCRPPSWTSRPPRRRLSSPKATCPRWSSRTGGGHRNEGPPAQGARAGIKVPKVDLKAPQVDIKGPKLEVKGAKGEVTAPDLEVSLPSVEVDTQAPGAKLEGVLALGDKEVGAKDSKFKMPKFKMPSFGVSAPGKSIEAAVDVSLPKAPADVSRAPDLSIELPPAGWTSRRPPARGGAQGTGGGHRRRATAQGARGLKAPQVDIKGPKLEVKGARARCPCPAWRWDTQHRAPTGRAPGLGTQVQKPKFKSHVRACRRQASPSGRGGSVLPKAGGRVPAVRAGRRCRPPSWTSRPPSGRFKLPEATCPRWSSRKPGRASDEGPPAQGARARHQGAQGGPQGPAGGHQGPRRGDGPRPRGVPAQLRWDTQAPGANERRLAWDKEVGAKDEVQNAKFKMPSFGVWRQAVHRGRGPRRTCPCRPCGRREKPVTSALAAARRAGPPEGHLPEVELKEPAAGIGLRATCPRCQGGPQGPAGGHQGAQVGGEGRQGREVVLPSVEVDTQAPGAKLEGVLALGDKEVGAKDSKFKMPKFKMPSHRAAVDVSAQGPGGRVPAVRAGRPAAAELDVKAAEAAVKWSSRKTGRDRLKGHLPKVHVPGIKVPKVDLKAPQVDIKGPKLEVKGAKGEVTAPDLEVSLPSVEVDTQAPGAKLEGVLALGDKEVGAKDSKFKMPKFKMPSFGVSAPGKSIEGAWTCPCPRPGGRVPAPVTSALSCRPPSWTSRPPRRGVKLRGHLPEVELKEPAAGIGLKGHLPKVHVPGIKPRGGHQGAQVGGEGRQGRGDGPRPRGVPAQRGGGHPGPGAKNGGRPGPGQQVQNAQVQDAIVRVSAQAKSSRPRWTCPCPRPRRTCPCRPCRPTIELPPAELDVKAAEAAVKLPEGHLPEVELKEPAAGIGLKGHLPKVHVPGIKAPQVDIKGPKLEVKGAKGEVTAPDLEVSLPSVEVDTQAPGAKLEGVLALGDKEESAAVADSGFPVSPSPCAEPAELSVGVSCAEAVFTREPSLPAPRPPCPSFPSETLHLSRGQVESPTRSTDGGVTLTKYQVTLPRAAVPAELPLEPGSGSQQDACFPSTDSPALLQPQDGVALSQTESPVSPADPLLPPAYGRVTFPKFHRPKFGFSIPKAAGRELEPRAVEFVPTPSPPRAVWGPASAAEGAPELGSPGSQPPCSGVSVSGSADTAVSAAGEAMAEDADREGKGSPLKMLKFKLPSFRRSPKKGARPLGEPGHSLEEAKLGVTVDTGPTCVPPGLPVAPTEVGVDAPLEKDVGEGATKTPGCAHVGPAPPRMQASVRGAGLPPGDPAASASRLPAEGDSHASQKASGEGGAGDTGTVVDLPEGVGVDPHLPQVHSAHLGFARPDLRPSAAKVATSSASGPLPRHGLPLGDGSQGPGPGDTSASQPHVEVAAPLAGDPLSPSCGTADAAALVRQSPEEGAVAGVPGSQRGWFRAPALRLPGVQRPAEARGGEGLPGPPVQAPAASAPAEGPGAPGSEGTAPMSLQPPEAGAESTCGTDVLKRNLDIRGLELHCPPAQAPAAHLSTPEVRVRPGEGCLPLHVPSGRLSETQAPAGETGRAPAGPPGLDLAGGAGGAEDRSSQPEGPVRLRASSTGLPSQVSVVNMGQPWEGSVLTVKLPRLDMPRFTFPDPSSEADVFIPTVSEVRCPGSSLGDALRTQSPGDWGASILKAGAGVPGEQPVALDLSPEDSPISKVRVHIQGAQVESPEVTVRKVTAELEDLSGPEAFSTQIVRESEIPASKIQTASYGFSLLKVKIPEPPRQVRVQDPRPREGSGEASKRDAPEADPVSGDLQPDTGEPFEVIMSSTGVPERPAFTPELCPGLQGVDSCSDEEAAEILDFPPEEDSGEAAACPAAEDRALQEKPEGKRSSGLFRSWLPNIGFSSSGEETCADPREEVRRSAPVQTQPGVPPEAQLPKKQEKAGWFRLPKLGFSSSPTKMSKSPEDEAALAEQKPQEEAITFFDARESFSPEDKEEGDQAEAAGAGPGTRAMVTPAARTELILLEQDRGARDVPAPGPATKKRVLGPSFHPDDACVHLDSGTENRAEAPEASQAAVTQPSYGGTHTCPAPHESPGHAAALRRAVMTVGVDVGWVLLLKPRYLLTYHELAPLLDVLPRHALGRSALVGAGGHLAAVLSAVVGRRASTVPASHLCPSACLQCPLQRAQPHAWPQPLMYTLPPGCRAVKDILHPGAGCEVFCSGLKLTCARTPRPLYPLPRREPYSSASLMHLSVQVLLRPSSCDSPRGRRQGPSSSWCGQGRRPTTAPPSWEAAQGQGVGGSWATTGEGSFPSRRGPPSKQATEIRARAWFKAFPATFQGCLQMPFLGSGADDFPALLPLPRQAPGGMCLLLGGERLLLRLWPLWAPKAAYPWGCPEGAWEAGEGSLDPPHCPPQAGHICGWLGRSPKFRDVGSSGRAPEWGLRRGSSVGTLSSSQERLWHPPSPRPPPCRVRFLNTMGWRWGGGAVCLAPWGFHPCLNPRFRGFGTGPLLEARQAAVSIAHSPLVRPLLSGV
ncbi:Protein AHNAK2 [Camelus dromedarius]|uniref:Protein AHNAK2 n=1 Tax=Camelus dromedarius TaxID=9838 RepID=A0A5N4E1U4_CAMDR|nr:Protein AHNAK2 [Camelus dromedarius]